jgi:hypothetical protein
MKNLRHLSLRIDDDLLQKFHYVADYDGRSANNQVLYLIKKCIADFEKEHGNIDIIEK